VKSPLKILVFVFLGVALSAQANDEPMTVNIKRLKMETALRIAQAAIKQCRKEGVQIAVTVVDRGGIARRIGDGYNVTY